MNGETRPAGLLVALLAGFAVLAGCGLTPPYRTSPASPSPTGGSSPSARPSTPNRPPDLSESTEFTASGPVPQILDASLVADIVQGVRSDSDSTRHVFASWPQFGNPGVDALIGGYYTDTIHAFDADHPVGQDDPAPELNLGWHLVASSPKAIGIVADGYLFADGETRERWRSFWFDPTSGTALAAAELADPAATNLALADAASAVTGVAEFDLGRAGADPLSAATLVAFGGDGSLLVGYDACGVAACSAGRVTLAVPPATTAGLLTTAGRAAQAATLSPTVPLAAAPSTPDPGQPSVAPTSPKPTGKVNCRKVKCVALTFDDGPGPFTTTLLGHLRKAEVPATFFMLGQQVETYPKAARAVAAAGHEIGVHTWDHRELTRLNAAAVRKEITSSIRIVKQVTGQTPTLFRPPYGSTNPTVAAEAKRDKVAQILWNVDTLDWKSLDSKKVIKATLQQTRRGSIVLLHDIHKTSVAAVPGIIEKLRKKGYTFVTVSQLLGKTKPGRKYFGG